MVFCNAKYKGLGYLVFPEGWDHSSTGPQRAVSRLAEVPLGLSRCLACRGAIAGLAVAL